MTPNKTIRKKLIFLGTSSFALPALQTLHLSDLFEIVLVITQPDKPQKRNKQIIFSPIKQYALKNNMPLFQPSSLKDAETIKFIKNAKPDIMVVVSYGQIIPKAIIDIPPFGIINIHGSCLPKYRGASPIAYALLNDEKETGVTIMLIDEKMDHGPILANASLSITPKDNVTTLSEKLSKLGASLLETTLRKYINKTIKPHPQDHEKATYTKLLKKEDGSINWDSSANDISNQIRAYADFPTSYTFFEGKRLKITNAYPISLPHDKKAGSLFIHDKKLAVYCKTNALVISQLQLEGKKEILSEAFLQGYDIMQKTFSNTQN